MKLYQLFFTVLKIVYILVIIGVTFIPKSATKEIEELDFIKENIHKLLSVSTSILLIVLYNPIIAIKKDSHDDFIVFVSGIFLLLSQIKTLHQTFSNKNE